MINTYVDNAERFEQAMKEIDLILDFEFGDRRDSIATEDILKRQQELLHDRGIRWGMPNKL